MKLWMRVVVGTIIGVVLGLLLPEAGGDALRAFTTISRIVMSVGRYAAFPLVFFGVAIAVQELREERITSKVYAQSVIVIVAATVAMVLVGTLIILLLAPRRIPPIFQETSIPVIPSIPELLLRTFPRNLFSLFAGAGDFLLPISVLAVVIGAILYSEGPSVVPASDLFDSATRIFYRLNTIVLEVLAVGMIGVAAYWVLQLRSVSDLQLFTPLILVVALVCALFVLIGFPLLVFAIGGRYNPFAWLYAQIVPGLLAFFSGNAYFAYGALTRVAKENFGVSRAVSAPVLSLSVLFAKAGSAMVIATAFVTVLRSYTALETTAGQVIWIMVVSIASSFLLGSVPGAPVVVGLSVLARGYGQGMEEVYLILLPALPILTGLAVVTDVMTASFVTYLVARWEQKRRIVDVTDFI